MRDSFPGLRTAYSPVNEAAVDACRHDGVDLAVKPDDQCRVAVDLGRVQ
jgi:hypothetical protein